MKSVKFHRGLAPLIEALCAPSLILNTDRIETLLRSFEIDLTEIQPFVRFSADQYTRNLVYGNDRFQILVLCWGPFHGSPVHAHGTSVCGVKVIAGAATESCYHTLNDPHPYTTRILAPNDVTVGEGPDVHKVTNNSMESLITLHIYSPPLVMIT